MALLALLVEHNRVLKSIDYTFFVYVRELVNLQNIDTPDTRVLWGEGCSQLKRKCYSFEM